MRNASRVSAKVGARLITKADLGNDPKTRVPYTDAPKLAMSYSREVFIQKRYILNRTNYLEDQRVVLRPCRSFSRHIWQVSPGAFAQNHSKADKVKTVSSDVELIPVFTALGRAADHVIECLVPNSFRGFLLMSSLILRRFQNQEAPVKAVN
jgi:hypothetical protein